MADNVKITEGTGVDIAADEIAGVKHQRVKIQYGSDGSATDVSPTNPLPVTGTLSGITNSIDVYVLGTGGTITVKAERILETVAVYFSESTPSITSYGLDGSTKRPLRMNSDGAIKVYDISQGTVTITNTGFNVNNSPTITGITNTIRIGDIPGTIAVYFSPSVPTVNASFTASSLEVVPTTGSRRLYDEPYQAQRVLIVGSQSNASLQITGITNTIRVGDIPGTVAIYFSQSEPTVKVKDVSRTSIISGTVSGSYQGSSDLGITLVSPESGRAIKVYALQITTTAQVQTVVRFTNGAGSATEYWRYALQAPSSGISGANLAVPPPGYLFATAAGSTLALVTQNASLIHYSIAYFKESG